MNDTRKTMKPVKEQLMQADVSFPPNNSSEKGCNMHYPCLFQQPAELSVTYSFSPGSLWKFVLCFTKEHETLCCLK